MINLIPENYSMDEICKMGQGAECCRYLAVGAYGFECLKNTSSKAYIDSRVASDSMTAQGDNCKGIK